MRANDFLHHENKACCLSRREFIGGCAAGAVGVTAMSAFAGTSALSVLSREKAPALGYGKKSKIRLVLAYPDRSKPIWPNIGYDFDTHNTKFVSDLRKACPTIEFIPCEVMSDEDAQKIVAKDQEVDGYVVYLSGCLWGKTTDIISDTGKPTVFVDHLFAGTGAFLTGYGRAMKAGKKVVAISSSRMEDVAEAARCIDCLIKLRQSTILVVGRKPDESMQECFGTRMMGIDFPEISASYENADIKLAQKQADKWIGEAQRVIEPKRNEIVKSAAMYLAMSDLMSKHKAQAIAVNCLGGFYGGHIKAYPCLGFMQLNNDGYVGACEADQRSAITMLLMTYLIGRPGMISDPVIDTSKNQIIYAHCVAPTKVFGPNGPSNPFHIRDHSEDRKGACDRSLMPLGEMTTTIKFDHTKKQVIFHQGKTVENVDRDLACRNKLAVEVKGDVYKLLDKWGEWGWHRVTFFGDHKRAVYNVAALLGFSVVEEA